jgi:hypothetical protein
MPQVWFDLVSGIASLIHAQEDLNNFNIFKEAVLTVEVV